MRENANRNNSEYGRFLRSDHIHNGSVILVDIFSRYLHLSLIAPLILFNLDEFWLHF